MRFKILTILSLILLFSGCKKKLENEEAELIEQNNTQGVSEKDIEDLDYIDYALDQKNRCHYTRLDRVSTNPRCGK